MENINIFGDFDLDLQKTIANYSNSNANHSRNDWQCGNIPIFTEVSCVTSKGLSCLNQCVGTTPQICS